eukprot:1785834-Pyramimonas_sp.AAC.1
MLSPYHGQHGTHHHRLVQRGRREGRDDDEGSGASELEQQQSTDLETWPPFCFLTALLSAPPVEGHARPKFGVEEWSTIEGRGLG